MKFLHRIPANQIALTLLLGLSSTVSLAALPSAEYECQVIAEGGRIGLVMVQADTRALAEKAAVGAQAFTTDKVRSRATKVVQCIRRGEETFTDYQFQQFVATVPR